MINRTGEEIQIRFITDNGKVIEAVSNDISSYNMSHNIARDYPSIICRNPASIGRLANILYKTLQKKPTNLDRLALANFLSSSNLPSDIAKSCKFIEISFRGQTHKIKVYENGFYYIIIELHQIYLANQYNLSDILKDKIVVDAGANIGVFSLMCAAYSPKRIYAFEPIKETYDILVENVKENGLENIIFPINKAIGDIDTKMELSHDGVGDLSASISPDSKRGPLKFKQIIEVVSLDNFMKDEQVGYIKMDIEGYEENALNGGRNLIKKYKPILSFSAYHKKTDHERLPQIIKEMRSDYTFSLNKFDEEDFYCD